MKKEYQTTIISPFLLSGPGLHTGKFIHATVIPAQENTGIVLRRVDGSTMVDIPALAEYVCGTNHGTTIAVGDKSVSTIEHMMAAFHGMGLDNAIVEVDGPEVPILDGSAHFWVEGIKSVGLKQLGAERRYYALDKTVEWSDPKSGILMRGEPFDGFQVFSQIEFESKLIGSQQAVLTDYDQFEREFSRCRTFVFLHEVEALLSLNLIKGGDLDNALVFVDKPLGDNEKDRLAKLFNRDPESIQERDGVLNTIEPFSQNEPARHKLLDFIGDIYLCGIRLKGKFTLRCPGHRANTEFAKTITKIIKNNNTLLDN